MSNTPPHALWDVKREALVPISIDLDIDGVRVIDAFLWDLHQSQVSKSLFLLGAALAYHNPPTL